MAGEIGMRLVKYGGYLPEQIIATHYHPAKADSFQKKTNIPTVLDNRYAVENSKITVLCVRPQQIKAVVDEIASVFPKERGILVTLAVGRWLSWISARLQTVNVGHFHPTSLLMVTERWNPGPSLWVAHPQMDKHVEGQVRGIFEKSIGEIWQMSREDELPPLIYLVGNAPAHLVRILQAFVQAVQERTGETNVNALQIYRVLLASLYQGIVLEQKSPHEVIERIATKQGVTRAGLNILDEVADALARELILVSIQRIEELANISTEV